MTADKLCIDCKHYRCAPVRWWAPPPPWHIVNECRKYTSPVTGNVAEVDCHRERHDGECGPEGHYWEPRA